ncbi:MAG: DNA-3-methyladenine glycosylase [Acidimicrobiales bacterium]|nr:DNA-3-methyladenine glycosylase [Acidimicrobiales bacterium]
MSGLGRRFFRRDPREVAPDLLGKLLIHDVPAGTRRAGRIVEVEAYCGGNDPAAHTFRGRTARNDSMFADGGTLYVYRSYGIHWCANVVCSAADDGVAVLLRALAPVEGIDAMYADRGGTARQERDLCSGPGKLTQAMGIAGDHDGSDLVAGSNLSILDDGHPVGDVVQTTRVGISVAVHEPWRWYVAGDPNVSRR